MFFAEWIDTFHFSQVFVIFCVLYFPIVVTTTACIFRVFSFFSPGNIVIRSAIAAVLTAVTTATADDYDDCIATPLCIAETENFATDE